MKKIISTILIIITLFTAIIPANAYVFTFPYDRKCEKCGSVCVDKYPHVLEEKTCCTEEGWAAYWCWDCQDEWFIILPAFPCTFVFEKSILTNDSLGERVYFKCTVCGAPEYINYFNDYDFIIHGYVGSEGEMYAKKYGLDFVVFDKGDADENTKVDINDVTCMQKIIAKINPTNDFKTANCDLNGDGKLNIRDATLLQLYLANKIDKFPVQK